MNYKLFIIGIVATFMSTSTQAQFQSIELFMGPSRTSTHGERDTYSFAYDPLYNYSVGVGTRYKMTTRSGLAAKLMFEDRGSKGPYSFRTVGDGDPVIGQSTYKMNIRYLTLPILYSFRFGRKVNFSLDIGPHTSFQLYRRAEYYFNDEVTDSGTWHDQKRFEIGLSLGFGMDIPVNKNLAITIGLLDNYSLAETGSKSFPMHTNTLSLLSGVRYNFNKD